MKRLRIIFFLVFSLLVAGCAREEPPVVDPVDPPVTGPVTYAVRKVSEMTLREKVGQLFCIRTESLTTASAVTRVTPDMKELFSRYPCGGFILFAKNISHPSQIRMLTADLHDFGDYPLISVDEEGGSIARIANNKEFSVPRYGNMGSIGLTGNPKMAYEVGNGIGGYLLDFGFDIDLAPVSDVNTNPENIVIGDRAFGSDPALVAEMVGEYLTGLKANKVEGCLKHFPGHGDTKDDTHYGYAETRKTWEEIAACEMVPFRKGIEKGARMIMTAHISVPKVTGSEVPSTLSPVILTEKLRGELGYTGVIITDGMEMGAVTKEYSPAEASILAILAGADIILAPMDYKAAFDGVVAAVESGRISESRIDESVTRILALKRDILLSRDMLSSK